MKADLNEIEVNGIVYVKKDSVTQLAEKYDGMDYVIIRTYSAGVHAGYLKHRDGKEVVLVNSRRIWYWDGAASLSQLAVDGVSKPENCKFAMSLPNIILTEAIEIIVCSEKAKNNIEGVPVWKK